jgi:DNA-binding PadR family transcriptional regulator
VNATAASLLGLLDLSGGELTGGDLVRVAQERIGEFWNLTRSQVYRELAVLEAEGHVRRGAAGPRESQPYRITAAGRRVYRSWLVEELPDETVRVPLLLVVAFGGTLPAKRVEEILDRSEADHQARLATYRKLDEELAADGANPFDRATLSFGIHYEEAVLRWFAALPTEVRRPTAAR